MIELLNNKLYFGVVEGVNDPEQKGRIQCRIIGLHTEDKSLIPTEDLPWCSVMVGSGNPFISGIGSSPVGAVEGSIAVLVAMQPDNMQEFLILGIVGGNRQIFNNSSNGFNDANGYNPQPNYGSDVNILARGKILSTSPINNQAQNTARGGDITSNTTPTTPIDPALAKKIPWFAIAQSQLKINEERNPDVIKGYLKTCGFNNCNVSTPWCSAFCKWCFTQAKIPTPGINGLARSWLKFGRPVALADAPVGSIVVIKGDRGASSGHVTLLAEKWDGKSTKIKCLGGNQTYDVNSGKQQTGGQVTISTFKISSIVDIRFPA